MGIFDKIQETIFGRKDDNKAPESEQTPAPEAEQAPETREAPAPEAAPAPAQPAPINEVDVEARLNGMSGADKLDWRVSIVDLMKLIGVDSSYANRKALAQELGRSNYSGSAEDNIWLHRTTMQALARNGGKVPAEFLD